MEKSEAKIYFKLDYTIREFPIAEGELLKFKVGGVREIKLEIRAPNKTEQKKGFEKRNAFCKALLEAKLSNKNEVVFNKIRLNKMMKEKLWTVLEYEDKNGNTIKLPSYEYFPEHFRSFLDQIYKELSVASNLAIKALRWRTSCLGPHNVISFRSFDWSDDRKFWHPAPTELSCTIEERSRPFKFTKEVRKDIRQIIKNDFHEPVYHELYREAWGNRRSNPRSAIVTGMSSLEVATKALIAQLIPDASWLTKNIPSPPLVKMLIEYIPRLPVVNKVKGKVCSPPKILVDKIRKGVTIRNDITHVGEKAPSYESLTEILEAVRDIIWLLDYFSGKDWAYEFISEETRFLLEN